MNYREINRMREASEIAAMHNNHRNHENPPASEVEMLRDKIARLEAECAGLKVSQSHLRDIVAKWLDMWSLDMGDVTEVKTHQWEELSDIMLAALFAMQAGEKP